MVGLGIAAVQLFLILVALLIGSMVGWVILSLLRRKRASRVFGLVTATTFMFAAWVYISVWGFTWFG